MTIVKIVKENHVWFIFEEKSKEKFEKTSSGLLKDAEVFTSDSQNVGIIVQPSTGSEARGYTEGSRILLPPAMKTPPFKIKGKEYFIMPHSEILSVL